MAWRIGAVAAILLCNSPRAAETGPDFRELERRGDSQVRTGSVLIGSGLALLPLSAIALVPVLHDGAFGITAADPGFAIFFAVAGGGLIHAGIPFLGFGAEKLERAAFRLEAGSPGAAEAGWSHYRRGFRFQAGGLASLLLAYPFVIVAALDLEGENETAARLALGLGGAGLGLLAIGTLEQYYGLHRFSLTVRDARRQLRSRPAVSLVPDIRWDGQGGTRAGLRLVGTF